VFVQDKCGRCKKKLKMNLHCDIFSKMNYSCFPKLAGMEVKAKLEIWTKISTEDLSVPVYSIYTKELSDI
jgi:hypothetical protein